MIVIFLATSAEKADCFNGQKKKYDVRYFSHKNVFCLKKSILHVYKNVAIIM